MSGTVYVPPGWKLVPEEPTFRMLQEFYGALEIDTRHGGADTDSAQRGYRAMLAASPPSPAEVEWKPIETAPKDGTTILMGKFHEGDFYWMASGRIEAGQFWCDFPDEFFVPFSHQNPTHWMPCPKPPALSAGGRT